jgi:hypothetical protein
VAWLAAKGITPILTDERRSITTRTRKTTLISLDENEQKNQVPFTGFRMTAVEIERFSICGPSVSIGVKPFVLFGI